MPFRQMAAAFFVACAGFVAPSPALGGTISYPPQFSREVAAAAALSSVGRVQPPLARALADPPGTHTSSSILPKSCNARYRIQLISKPAPCTFGDASSSTVVVLVGSSHAGMWLRAAIDIAVLEHIALKTFIYTSCVPIIDTSMQTTFNPTDPRVTATTCATWNANVGAAISALRPSAVLLGSGTEIPTTGRAHGQWVRGMTAFLASIHADRKYIIGATPHITTAGDVAQCLLNHTTNIKPCVTTVNLNNQNDLTTSMLSADKEIASKSNASLLDVTGMLCTTPTRSTRTMQCPPVIDGRLVYVNGSHLTVNFTTHIERFLQPIFADVAVNA